MSIKTLGQYTRTAPDPVDMDGGVTAALIEKDCPDPEVHEGWGSRDHFIPWKTAALNWKGRAERAERRADRAEHDRDSWQAAAEDQAREVLRLRRQIDNLRTAPTVPTRPEGAEEIEAVLAESPLGPEAVRGSLADFLASRGVRVEGNER